MSCVCIHTKDTPNDCSPDADGIVDPAVCLENEESCILDELVSARDQEEITAQHLWSSQQN